MHALADGREAVALGNERTEEQDVSFGLRQLVDIGIGAVPPAVDDRRRAPRRWPTARTCWSRSL